MHGAGSTDRDSLQRWTGRGAVVAGRLSDRSRKSRARLGVGAGLTVNALGFTVLGSAAHATYTPLALMVSAIGIFVTTWFLLDVAIAFQADAQRRRSLPQQRPQRRP